MNKISLEKLEKIKFAKELKEKFAKNINQNKNTKIINFEITNALAKNFDIIGYYMIKKKIKKINLFSKNKINFILKRNLNNHLKKYFLYYSKYFIIEFQNLKNDDEILNIGIKNYLNYHNKLNLNPKWNKEIKKIEIKKIEENNYFKKYKTFNDCIKLLEEFPYSKFNFPTEKNKDRFVFYFYMYSEKQKKILFEFLKKNKLDKHKLLLKLIKNNKINEEIFYYAFGFSYVNEKLIRFTLYTKFHIDLIKNDKLNEFIYSKHKFQIKPNYKNIWYYAVDFFPDNSNEFKFYDEPYFFNKKLKNDELNNILNNKQCVKVSKYKNGEIIDTKYEFEIQKYFNSNEQKILKKFKLYDNKNKILSIYLKDNKIKHKVFYNL